MLRSWVKVAIVVIAVLFVVVITLSDTIQRAWWFDRSASVSPNEPVGTGTGSMQVERIIDYQTGKIIYVTPAGVCVTDLKQK